MLPPTLSSCPWGHDTDVAGSTGSVSEQWHSVGGSHWRPCGTSTGCGSDHVPRISLAAAPPLLSADFTEEIEAPTSCLPLPGTGVFRQLHSCTVVLLLHGMTCHSSCHSFLRSSHFASSSFLELPPLILVFLSLLDKYAIQTCDSISAHKPTVILF